MNRKTRKLMVVGLTFLPLLAVTGCADPAVNRSPMEANTAFAVDLYAQLKTSPGNLFISPYSVSTALAMTYAGARGETERQMSHVLYFDTAQGQVHSSFAALQNQLADAGKKEGIQLNVANALWAQKGHPFLPAFLNIARSEYKANVDQVDFTSEWEAARNTINRWVAQQTKDKIQDILPPGSVGSATRLVLANAIYFKGIWAKQFDKTQTSPQPFHLSSTRQADAPLMHHLDEVRYMENGEFQAVELPYKGGELSMVILLPRQIEGCGALETRLSPALLSQTLGQMTQQKVEIFLPRFKLESSFKLNDTLVAMGMSDAFGARADFSGMDGAKDLYIDGVYHKAWGEVNEEGTEAAAATAIVMNKLAVMKPVAPPPVFRADHPFIFFIRDTRSSSLLFLGRLADPGH